MSSSKKDLKQAIGRLQRTGAVVGVKIRRGGHLSLELANGQHYITSATPSDWRTLANMDAVIKRMLKREKSR